MNGQEFFKLYTFPSSYALLHVDNIKRCGSSMWMFLSCSSVDPLSTLIIMIYLLQKLVNEMSCLTPRTYYYPHK